MNFYWYWKVYKLPFQSFFSTSSLDDYFSVSLWHLIVSFLTFGCALSNWLIWKLIDFRHINNLKWLITLKESLKQHHDLIFISPNTICRAFITSVGAHEIKNTLQICKTWPDIESDTKNIIINILKSLFFLVDFFPIGLDVVFRGDLKDLSIEN